MSSIRQWNIQSYNDATKALGYGRKRERTLGYATRLLAHGDGTISVVHHSTPIVTYFKDGTVQCDTRGWRSATTKERLNLFTPINVWQRAFQWYWAPKGMLGEQAYQDGLLVDSRGQTVEYDERRMLGRSWA